ncbi:MAG: hypothetical protein KDA25_11510, partial [Phycisphaerales bacterium]|nr:hypothetical protein [Phycisphaerales bacterium]
MSVIRRLARPTSRLLSAVIVTGAGAMLAGDTGADVVKASYITNTFYNYKLLHMPDLDQRRSTLPADGGMYCVPTSVFNMFAYAANHGYPAAPPEDGDWQLQSKYIEATLWLNVIGNWMNTDPDDGTSGSGTKAGMDALIAQAPYLKRVHKGLSSSYNPTVAKLALYGCQGWAMSFVYGKWAVVGTHNGLPVVDRVGGHAVTLTRAYRDSDQWILRYRDPADDTALTTQSAFKNTTRTPYNYSAYYGGTSIYNIHSLNAIFNTSGGTRVIDTIYGIRPLYGLTFHNTGGAVTGGGGLVQMLDPLAFEGSENTTLPSVTIPSSLAVLDFDFDGDFQNALVIATSSIFPLPPRLRTLDLTTGQLAILTPSPQGLRRFATDRFNHIYAFDGGGVLHFLAEDGTPLASTEAIPDPTEVAVHTGDDSVWIISVPERTVVKLFADFSETLLTQVVPAAVPMAGDA